MGHEMSLVVATKDRPSDLRNLLSSLSDQSLIPFEVIIVDASLKPVLFLLSEFPSLNLRYIRHMPPSAAAQRNAGIQNCSPASTLIGFVDDDTVFEPQAFEVMLRFWNSSDNKVLGAAFNILNPVERRKVTLKSSHLVGRIGLYAPDIGRVCRSGWQTVISSVSQNTLVEWLPSTAVLFRRDVFSSFAFDEVFESYSYLEDLDFSYALNQMGKLVIVADASYFHHPSKEGRVSARQFGRCEVKNRLYFVRKHKLSIVRCYIAIGIRLLMTVFHSLKKRDINLYGRALGNVEAIIRASTSR